MIVLDEQLNRPELVEKIAAWYPGRVAILTELRADSKIPDEATGALLRTVKQPTFVTINVKHFWRVIRANARFAVVAIELPAARVDEVSDYLRRFLKTKPFETKAGRMGVVVLLRPTRIELYRVDRKVETMKW